MRYRGKFGRNYCIHFAYKFRMFIIILRKISVPRNNAVFEHQEGKISWLNTAKAYEQMDYQYFITHFPYSRFKVLYKPKHGILTVSLSGKREKAHCDDPSHTWKQSIWRHVLWLFGCSQTSRQDERELSQCRMNQNTAGKEEVWRRARERPLPGDPTPAPWGALD